MGDVAAPDSSAWWVVGDRAKELDQIFTNPAVVTGCLVVLERALGVPLAEVTHVLEPSAGNGAFYRALPAHRRVGLDIDAHPSGPLERVDFLQWSPPAEWRRSSGGGGDAPTVVTVGNPPYGSSAALAVRFLNRALEFSDVVAFVLPWSFARGNKQNSITASAHLVANELLPQNSFHTPGGEARCVRCVFQVWVRASSRFAPEALRRAGSPARPRWRPRGTHPDFEWCAPGDAGAIAIRRVGRLAGTVFVERVAERSVGNHLFLVPRTPAVLERLMRLELSQRTLRELNGQASAFPWYTRTDIIEHYDPTPAIPAASALGCVCISCRWAAMPR